MKSNRLGICFLLVLGMVGAVGQGCGKSDSPTKQEFNDDNARFNAAKDKYNTVVASDFLGKYTNEEKIAACDGYITEAENIIAKYPEGKELRDRQSTIKGAEGVKGDLAKVRGVRTALVSERDDRRMIEKLKGEMTAFIDDGQKFTTDLALLNSDVDALSRRAHTDAEIDRLIGRADGLIVRGETLSNREIKRPQLNDTRRQSDVDQLHASSVKSRPAYSEDVKKLKDMRKKMADSKTGALSGSTTATSP